MEITMAKSEGILGPLTKVEVVISPENTKVVSIHQNTFTSVEE